MHLNLCGRVFDFVGHIEPERDPHGLVIHYMPQDRYDNDKNLPLNAHGEGPFCWFKIASKIHAAGVYAITLNGQVMYIGECQNLSRRFGPRGYGSIQPRNCFRGGQVTNCRVNHLILEAVARGGRVGLFFCQCRDRKALERRLLRQTQSPWNAQTAR